MNRFTLLTAAALISSVAGFAQDSAMNSGQLAHALDRLSTSTRVLYIAAHPDDENTKLLTALANERHFTVAYLSMTRGGGGQNLIGSEQGELLDVIRTEELLAARGLDGAEQWFTRMKDFGYTKRADEALSIWGHDDALSDVVRVIRTYQPDIIVTRFDELPPNHGHHTASAILAREGFAAAADATKFPEHKLPAWKALRLVNNVTTFRDIPIPPDAVPVDVGGYDPRSGLSHGELAALSRSQHKSQGFGVAGERGSMVEKFVFLAGEPLPASKDPFADPNAAWARFGAAGQKLKAAIDEARGALTRDTPEKAVPALLKAHAALEAMPADDVRVRHARKTLERILTSALGIFTRATAPRPTATPGSTIEMQLEVLARRPGQQISIKRVAFPDAKIEPNTVLTVNKREVFKQQVKLPAEARPTLPYWLEENTLKGRYTVKDDALIGVPRGPAALTVEVTLDIADRPLTITTPVIHSWTDRVHGERLRPFLIVPPATITPMRESAMATNGKPAPVLLRVRAYADKLQGAAKLTAPAGWTVTPASLPVELAKAGDETMVHFDVTPAPNATVTALTPTIEVAGVASSFREDVIDYPHIPFQLVLQPASVKVAPLKTAVPKGLIGYVVGSGDTIPEDLMHIGAKVELVDDATLRAGDLSRFPAIVIGIRAYNSRPTVRLAHDRLMAYVERGGRLVTQYNTTSRWAPLDTQVGPYPFEISNDRITDETAEMIAIDPKHLLVTKPNAIGPADFEGWVQERGIYFAKTWDAKYTPLYKAADPQEQPLSGGTIVAKYGKGRYVYTGLAFFRQLRAGVPGAYRLFINFIE